MTLTKNDLVASVNELGFTKKKSVEIIETLIEIMKEFCVQYKPKKITFSAAVTEDNQSRSRVYEKMLQRHVPSMGYRYIAGKKYGGKVKFTMERLN